MITPRRVSLVIIIQDGRILLGRKIGSPEIGAGTLNGPGGKFDAEEGDRTMQDCAVRETEEEFGIVLDRAHMQKTNIVNFFVDEGEDEVLFFEGHIFHAPVFMGEPRITDAMIPEWHAVDTIPYKERMLEADPHWFPRVVAGEQFNLDVFYREPAKGFKRIGKFLPFADTEID